MSETSTKMTKTFIEIGKLVVLRSALTNQVHNDMKYGNGNITDFSYNNANENGEHLLGKTKDGMPQSYVDYIKANPDVAYNIAVITGDQLRAKYPNGKAPKGSNEIYTNIADGSTPPFTHKELLDRVSDAVKALA